uniref:DUF4817 domain-containing protein n=1 Tax=Rhabditophanes sp. KR3021 TaxID=114890 RepID=A0AC35THS0_9BILA
MQFTRVVASRVLSALEKAKLVCWLEETNSLAIVKRRYISEFGMEPPTVDLIKKWHEAFLKTGSITSQSVQNNIPLGAIANKSAGSSAARA